MYLPNMEYFGNRSGGTLEDHIQQAYNQVRSARTTVEKKGRLKPAFITTTLDSFDSNRHAAF
jgi:hypothetical protein